VTLALAPRIASATEVIIRASDVSTIRGNWHLAYDDTAAGGQYLASNNNGWSNTNAPLASPGDYLEASFSAPAGYYHVWLRLRATGNNKYNESVWVQYSDAVNSAGSAIYRIGSTSGLLVNLERCNNCGVSGWGWQDGAYWMSQTTTVRFTTTGTHRLRVQTREDGVQIDQIVLSSDNYRYESPGEMVNDRTIVSETSADTATTVGPYNGTRVRLPGRVEAENFDNGSDGVSYHDPTSGNAGGAYRQTNVDIERCAEGGYNVGYVQGGEWANYSVTVATAGSYYLRLRVASLSGGSLHAGFNGPSSVWSSVSVPATGGWQSWRTVQIPVRLGAGNQLLTLAYDSGSFNVNYAEVVAATTTTTPTQPSTSGGSTVTAVTWNIAYNSSTSHAQRAIDLLMNLSPRPQIVILQEALRAHYNTYVAQLRTRTGQTWSGHFANHCPRGALSGSSCTSSEEEGVAVLTSLPVVNYSSRLLPYADAWHSARVLVRVGVNVGGVVLQVFGTHLQPDYATARYNSMSVLKSYASGFSVPQIVGGDFNADPDQIDTTRGMLPNFINTWRLVGSGTGYTRPTTSPTMKLDYLFTDAGRRANPTSTRVATNTGSSSDHYPVVATFSVR
jgi:endonuclease/exonuclease/phosphatase family metal-dependent hydrolase